MNPNDSDATRLTVVDIALPLEPQDGSAWGGVDAASAYADTAFAPLGDVAPISLADVAAHPGRLRMKWSGPVLAKERSLSAVSAIRTGPVGLGELAACGQ